MIYRGEQVHCSECGSENMIFVRLATADVLIECNECGAGALGNEFDEWKDDWKKLPQPISTTSRLKGIIRSII